MKKVWLFVFIGLVLCSPSWALTNGDFESGSIDPWDTGAGTYTITFGNRPGGSGSFYLQMIAVGSGANICQTDFGTYGETYRIRAWIRNDSGSGNITFGLYYGSASSLIPVETVAITSSSWQEYSVEFSLMHMPATPQVGVLVGSSGTVSVDDIVLEHITGSETSTPTFTPTPTMTPTATHTFTPVNTPTEVESGVEFWKDLE